MGPVHHEDAQGNWVWTYQELWPNVYAVITNDVGPADNTTRREVEEILGCEPCAIQFVGTAWAVEKLNVED